ncbi:MAG: CDP-glycerol glycerophosphotransferase family protein [Atopobiaceae bacterium]|nr:CDP-glycerol glycerophosphotransferase family protein [Atopobiaceae bacterium]
MARNKMLWVFNAGPSYSGNPRWLFEYVRAHRPDITCYWLCGRRSFYLRLRAMGIPALLYRSKAAREVGSRAGVYVVNQYKEVIHDYLQGATILNLWHGVGCKAIENRLHSGILNEGIATKHIRNNLFYARDTLFLVTSPLMEEHFRTHCNLREDQILRAGYPCVTPRDHEPPHTFDHRIAQTPPNVRLALYAPTYRDYVGTSLHDALPNMEQLIETLRKANLRLIIKVHPNMSRSPEFAKLRAQYESCPQLLFWNNDDDIYEILDQIHLAIVDYSSMFYDLLRVGVRHFVRYTYDFERESQTRPFALDYHANTCGVECTTFEQLLEALVTYEQRHDSAELARLDKLFWSYATGDACGTIVERTLEFEPASDLTLPTLYSFDVFDTLLGRTTHLPEGIFHLVAQQMAASSAGFSSYLIANYPNVRAWCEKDERDRRLKSPRLTADGRTEIRFEDIFDRMAATYGLTEEQRQLLMDWELDAEYRCSYALEERVRRVRELVEAGEDVVLISDMYLSKEFVGKLLAKADPMLATLPLFLSSDRGGQKTRKALFLDVYEELDYAYGSWIHCGDNPKADYAVPKRLGITCELCEGAAPLLDYEHQLIDYVGTGDAYVVAHMLAEFRRTHGIADVRERDYFTYGICALYFVPYLRWVIRDACKRNIRTLYFISRDGYLLKLVADELIRTTGANLQTAYVYGSRKAWRLPSQIEAVDDDYFMHYGTFAATFSYERILEKSMLSEDEFKRMFPSLGAYRGLKRNLTKAELENARLVLSQSEEYRAFLLERAAEERPLVEEYLRQTIDTSHSYAFVEYWGRGYTQTCLTKLLCHATGTDAPCPFYYARSIDHSEGLDVRYNFSANSNRLVFIESLFANHPHDSVEGYCRLDNGSVAPVIAASAYDVELFESLSKNLVRFAHGYAQLEVEDQDALDHALFDWALQHFYANEDNPLYIEHLANLQDSFRLNDELSSFAPPLTVGSFVTRLQEGRWPETKSIRMSVAQANPVVRAVYAKLKGVREEDAPTSEGKGKLHQMLAKRVKNG